MSMIWLFKVNLDFITYFVRMIDYVIRDIYCYFDLNHLSIGPQTIKIVVLKNL